MRALVLGLSILTGCRAATPSPDRPVTLRMFEVGYGDAVLVSAGGTHLLFDAGPEDAGATLVGKLRAAGVDAIDTLVLSHPHPDHYAGLKAVAASGMPIRQIIRNADPDWETVALPSVPTEAVSAASEPLIEGPFTLRFLHPAGLADPDPNNRSLVVRISGPRFEALFPGDLVDTAQQAALCDRLPARLDVLKLPHHGDHLAPCLGTRADRLILSVAENPWGVPRPETVDRYSDRIARTDRDGDLLFKW